MPSQRQNSADRSMNPGRAGRDQDMSYQNFNPEYMSSMMAEDFDRNTPMNNQCRAICNPAIAAYVYDESKKPKRPNNTKLGWKPNDISSSRNDDMDYSYARSNTDKKQQLAPSSPVMKRTQNYEQTDAKTYDVEKSYNYSERRVPVGRKGKGMRLERELLTTPEQTKVHRHLIGKRGTGMLDMSLTETAYKNGKSDYRKNEKIKLVDEIFTDENQTKIRQETTREAALPDKTGKKSKILQRDLAKIDKLVDEENAMVQEACRHISLDQKPKVKARTSWSTTFSLIDDSIRHIKKDWDDEPEEMQPELIAAMMHSEEAGMGLETAPSTLYRILFPNVIQEHDITVSSAVPDGNQDIVVPTSRLPHDFECSFNRDLEETVDQSIISDVQFPTTSFCQEIAQVKADGSSSSSDNMEKLTAFKSMLLSRKETYSYDTSTVDTLPEITAQRGKYALASKVDALNYDYSFPMENTKHVSYVQLRGALEPQWFPGYYWALPEDAGVKLASSPSAVLTAAWEAVKPDYVPSANNGKNSTKH